MDVNYNFRKKQKCIDTVFKMWYNKNRKNLGGKNFNNPPLNFVTKI